MSLVVFDFDGTLIEGDAGVHFARHLFGKGYLSAFGNGLLRGLGRVARLNASAISQATRGLSLHARYAMGSLDRHGMVERAYEGFEGLDADWVAQEMAAFAKSKLPRKLRSGVVDQLAHHIDDGDHVVVVSTGIQDLIWPLREVLGLDFEVVACRLRTRNEQLLGTVEGPLDGTEKATRVVAISKRRDHELSEAWAYADHEDDQAILDMVGNPVAVHPTSRMEQIARDRGWPILLDD